jgi:replicative DNA helicase
MERLKEVGGAAYLSHLISNVPTSLHIEHYARVVQNNWLQRLVISMGSQVSTMGYDITDPNELLSKVGQVYLKVQEQVAQPQLLSPKEWAEKSLERYMRLSGGRKVSISTGITQLDYATGGVFPGEYWVVAGDPRIGKTTLAIQWAENLSVFGNVLFCSLEMGYHDITDRRVSLRLGQPFRVLRSGDWDKEVEEDISKTMGELSESSVFYFGQAASGELGKSVTTQSIYAIARYMKMAHGLSAIIVDYLQAVGDDYGKSLYEKVTNISSKLQSMAKSLEIPVIVLCQLNREAVHRDDKRPRISDIRSSGNVEYDADVILLIYRDVLGEDESIRPDEAEIEIGKQRQSDVARQIIKLKWDAKKHIYYEDEQNKIQQGWWANQ